MLTRLGAPTSVVTILEGESLINDGVALTVFGLAVEAMAQPFTFTHGVVRLVEVVVGGIAYGMAVALVIGRVRRSVRDPSIQILITLITPFVAYIPAEQLNVSGVLATVVTGVYLGTRTEGMLQAASRVSGTVFWRTLVFLLESTLFVLLGLELRSVVDHLSRTYSVWWLAGTAAAEVAAVIVIRLAWELMVSPLIRFIPGRHSGYVRNPWRQRLVIGWGGMRGAISLAIALTLPLTHGRRFSGAAHADLPRRRGGDRHADLPGAHARAAARRARPRAGREQRRARRLPASGSPRPAWPGSTSSQKGAGEDTANVYRQLFELRLDRVRAALGDTDGDGSAPHTSGCARARPRAARQADRAVPGQEDQRRYPPLRLPDPRPARRPARWPPARLASAAVDPRMVDGTPV